MRNMCLHACPAETHRKLLGIHPRPHAVTTTITTTITASLQQRQYQVIYIQATVSAGNEAGGKRPRGQGQGPTPRQSQVLTGWLGRTPEALDTTKGRWTIDRYTDQLHWPHHWHCQPYHQHQPCLVNSIPVFRHCQWAGLAEKLGTFLFYFLQLYCSNGIYPVGNSGCFPWGKPAVAEWASCDSHATQPTVGMLSILVFP